MRHIHLKTEVQGSADEVFTHFNEDLFRFLKPPTWLAKIVRYDGTFEGAYVEMQFKLPWPQTMNVRIEQYSKEIRSFTDRGQILPFGITWWEHHHRVSELGDNKNSCIVEDDIHFDAPGSYSWLLWTAFYVSFWLRKPAYKKYFSRLYVKMNGVKKI